MNVSKFNFSNLKLALILLATILLLISSCKQNVSQNTVSKSIYFTLQDGTMGEIWMLSLEKNTEHKVLYRLNPVRIDFSDAKKANLMTQRFIEDIQSRFDAEKSSDTYLQTELNELALSPDKTLLAWKESMFRPPEYDIVQSAIKVMRIADQSIVATYLTFGAVEDLSWSPNSKHILFYMTSDNVSQISLLDIYASKIVDVSLGSAPIFSPTGEVVFAEFPVEWPKRNSCCQIININTDTVTKKEIDSYDLISKPFPSPDGKYVTVLAESKDGIPDLVMMDVDTLKTQKIPIQSIDANIIYFPLWSPMGDKIAMTIFNPNPSLFVFNKDVKKVSLQFQMDGVAEWKWSGNGEEMLILKLDYGKSEFCAASSAQLEIVSLKDKSIKSIDLPVSVYDVLHQELFKYICQPGIAWITW